MRATEASNYQEKRNSLVYEYIDFFESLGFLVISVPNNKNHINKYIGELNVDGIVLTGGKNVNPKLHGVKKILKVFIKKETQSNIIC